jgi:maleate isomerase
MYGWRGRLGLIVPSTNTVNEPDFYRNLPDGVSLHVSRMYLDQESHRERKSLSELERMAEHVDRCANLLSTADVDVIAYGCTSGSFMEGTEHEADLEARLREKGGVPAVTTSGAVRTALETLDVDSLVIVSPYTDDVLTRAVRYFDDCGFDVVDADGLGIDIVGSDLERESHGVQTPQRSYRQARALDHGDADSIFISCTNYHSSETIEQLEADLGKPVVTSNQATLWESLRTIGVDYGNVEFGSLFAR